MRPRPRDMKAAYLTIGFLQILPVLGDIQCRGARMDVTLVERTYPGKNSAVGTVPSEKRREKQVGAITIPINSGWGGHPAQLISFQPDIIPTFFGWQGNFSGTCLENRS